LKGLSFINSAQRGFALLGVSLVASTVLPAAQPLTGSQFVSFVAHMDPRQREHAIEDVLLAGDVPGFLKNLVPVKLQWQPARGKAVTATVFVMPEYLAIGSDKDFLRIPMNLYTAAAVASRLGYILPTKKIVDAVYRQSAVHFSPEPMTAGPEMRSTEYYRIHNEKIEAQAKLLGVMPGQLVAGDKKDVVLTNLLDSNPGRIAIFGWHRLNGVPIQPLSTVHGACYADYSHGIRLVSDSVLIDGERRSIYDVLQDPVESHVLNDEGPMPHIREQMSGIYGETPCDRH
jgi:hypothetical protein